MTRHVEFGRAFGTFLPAETVLIKSVEWVCRKKQGTGTSHNTHAPASTPGPTPRTQFRRRATLIRLTLHKSDAVERDGKLQGYARQGLRQIGQWDLASQDSTEPWELPSPLPFTWRRLTVAPQSLHNPV